MIDKPDTTGQAWMIVTIILGLPIFGFLLTIALMILSFFFGKRKDDK
jgi:hypothetical protein